MRLVLTAGFDRALHAVALAELARREGHTLAQILVVGALNASRVKDWVRKRGVRSLFDAARRAAGNGQDARDRALELLLEREDIAERSLSAWARRHEVPLQTVDSLDGARSLQLARAARPDATLYAGGGILKPAFLEAVGARVLNAHAGPLPAVRGMNACEWALLLGADPAVTIHWIDVGIDTGAVVELIPLELERGDDIETLRGKCAVVGVHGMLRALGQVDAPLPKRAGAVAPTRQCFTLSPVLRELLAERLERGAR